MTAAPKSEAGSAMRLTVAEGVARLVFTDGARGNPIDGRFCMEFSEAANALSCRDDVRAILISAEGRAFSYGGDVAMFVANLDSLPQEIKRWTTHLHSATARLQRMDAPTVAAVHGVCAGGMAAIVAGCDFVVAAEDARFVAAFCGIGYSCDSGSSVMVTRRMGLARTRRYFLLNETLNAREALAAGLVDECVGVDQLLPRCEALATQLAAGPTKAFGEIRRLLLSAFDQPLETQLELEAQALARMAATSDAREGLLAFRDKRAPSFLGR